MIMKSNLMHRAISILITSFFCLVVVLTTDNAFAESRYYTQNSSSWGCYIPIPPGMSDSLG